jgi:hypothetical protein
MKREFWVTVLVVALLLGSVVLKIIWEKKSQPKPADTANSRQALVNPGYPDVAAFIAGRINELSPSPGFDNSGWLASRVSFSTSKPLAYVDYTDTHVLLRLLLEYRLSDKESQTKVIATFLPASGNAWQLQFGRDEGAGQKFIDYIYNGDSKQWVPQELISK